MADAPDLTVVTPSADADGATLTDPSAAGAEGSPGHTEAPTTAPEDTAALRREAASWRTKLRDAETQRDALQSRVDRADKAEAERLASARLRDPDDLWLAIDLEEVRHEETGLVDAEKVMAAVASLVARKPHFALPAPNFDAGVRRSPALNGVSFGEALREAARTSG